MESGKIKVTTKQQFEKLVELMKKYPEIGRGKPLLASSKNKSKELWEEFALVLNSLGPPLRTAPEWGRVWIHYKAKLKRKLENNLLATGVGSSHKVSLSPLEESVAELIQIGEQVLPAGRSLEFENTPPAIENEGTSVIKLEFIADEATLGHDTTFEEDFEEQCEQLDNPTETTHDNIDDKDFDNKEKLGNTSRTENFEKTAIGSRKRTLEDSERPENIKRTKTASVIIEDPVNQNPISIKDDNFEQWVIRKKQLLEIELLEMKNYKFKLELLEIEQRLRLPASKFTRSIRGTQ